MFLLFQTESSFAQNSIMKSFISNSVTERGISFDRFHSDSLVFISGNRDSGLIYNNSFNVIKTDQHLNIFQDTRFYSENISVIEVLQIDSINFLVYGTKRDSIFNGVNYSLNIEFPFIAYINQHLDTIYVKSYQPIIPDIKDISIKFAGREADTLYFCGTIQRTSNSVDQCGLLLKINLADGQIFEAYSYCDSIIGRAFHHTIFSENARSIAISGSQRRLDLSSANQVTLGEIDFQGQPQQFYTISDSSSNVNYGGLIYAATPNRFLLFYETYKYQTTPNSLDLEFVLLDSNYQILNTKYRPHFSGTRLPVQFGEYLETTGNFRLWDDVYNIDINDSFLLQSHQAWGINFQLNAFIGNSFKTYTDFIFGVGYLRQTASSTFDLFVLKSGPNGNGCLNSGFNLSWPLNQSSATLSPNQIIRTVYTNIHAVPLTLTRVSTLKTDTTYCITTAVENIRPENSQTLLFPNPAENFCTIAGLNSLNTNFQCVDLLGRFIFSEYLLPQNGKADLNLHNKNLASGTYILSVTNNQQQFSLKLIMK